MADFTDYPLPCHPTIDYSDPDWLELQYPESPMCAGALVMMRNQSKMPRDPTRAALVRAVKPDADVFRYVQEFLYHHQPEWMQR